MLEYRNEITRFQQKFDETFYEAWDRFNDLLRGCPHHGFSELHQLDTFYNALNSIDQDSLNSAAGDTSIQACISSDFAELKGHVSQRDMRIFSTECTQTPASAPVKAVLLTKLLPLRPISTKLIRVIDPNGLKSIGTPGFSSHLDISLQIVIKTFSIEEITSIKTRNYFNQADLSTSGQSTSVEKQCKNIGQKTCNPKWLYLMTCFQNLFTANKAATSGSWNSFLVTMLQPMEDLKGITYPKWCYHPKDEALIMREDIGAEDINLMPILYGTI
ncbi:hypothetical protein Tco_1046576 [Tanacetum coccineum]